MTPLPPVRTEADERALLGAIRKLATAKPSGPMPTPLGVRLRRALIENA